MRLIAAVLFSIIFTGCRKPEFRFMQKVEVFTGFYEGCTGNIVSFDRVFLENLYEIKIDNSCPLSSLVINGDYLRAVEDKK